MHMRLTDLFKIGIGPSSSHTMGPMLAACRFLQSCPRLERANHIQVELYGSLALTGAGHATYRAILLGLMGETPEQVSLDQIAGKLDAVARHHQITLLGRYLIPFNPSRDFLWHKNLTLPAHPNAMRFTLTYDDGRAVHQVFYSTGGGFIYTDQELREKAATESEQRKLPFPFSTMRDLLAHGRRSGLSIADMLRANEQILAIGDPDHLNNDIDRIITTMRDCIERGLQSEGKLPGGLNVKRRAAALWKNAQDQLTHLPHQGMHQVSIWAMAVNEENAAGGRVVTAPTNGAAGIIPAVLRYYTDICDPSHSQQGARNFLLVAAAIGMLCKANASISGAEIGCQGEVGVACAMAAAGLTAALGGSNEQIETAAEIGIEHHLGMTCDPMGGLVQIPCIERNGVAAVKAITAASLALSGDGTHYVSLDQVIETMRQTGADMQSKYKETSLGGLALHALSVNVTAC
jgi:L-serine dehydratase